ncbi:hypothetical protein [Leisingera aquaemixtae]|uniref:hypothetical protein n=1 Tax=Leisingera aquaemixtae TaxID=1396826 RepID=UPI0011AEA824|nr:hypothetical protein [Leisingera aquaemixtae]
MNDARLTELTPMLKNMSLVFLTLTLCFAAVGCSYNEIGFVKNEVFQANGATVTNLAAPGLHISKKPEGMGISIGYTRIINVHSTICQTKQEVPELTFRRFLGFSIISLGNEISGTIGIRESLRPRRVAAGEDILRRIHFEPQNLHATVVELERSDCFGGQT